jgi:para-aminobenzoate synthetase component 1
MPGEPISDFIDLMDSYGAARIPFLFIIDFDLKKPEIHRLNSIPDGIEFSTPLFTHFKPAQIYSKVQSLKKHPITYTEYLKAFNNVMNNISLGNSYLLNLTFPTLIETDLTINEIFHLSVASYKLLYHNEFVVFSPEIFVRIEKGEMKSFPMKGTINASIDNAKEVILDDEKEMSEHNTIVDLIRNDMSIFADQVIVKRFRYIDEIRTSENQLYQVSSEICGRLQEGYESHLGEIIVSMLPAGSVTGAPKKETLRIIRESENYERNWYTGVFGIFDGEKLDSGVMIRYIEKNSTGLYYKSGGGITFLSDPAKEYEEMKSKIYVPVG